MRALLAVALLASVAGAYAAPLTPVDFVAWTERLEAQRGRIVVVDMWATWCSTCLTRFPKMVEMARRYEPRGVVFLSLCLDDREDAESLAAARAFLEKQDASFDHFLMDERLDVGFEKLGLLGIPVVVIYDRSGVEAARLTGDNPNDQFDEDDVKAVIERLLAAEVKPAA